MILPILLLVCSLVAPAYAEDTGATDTGATDTGLQHYGDTGPSEPTYGASDLAGDPGGCGCSQPGAAAGPVSGLILLFGLVIARRATRSA